MVRVFKWGPFLAPNGDLGEPTCQEGPDKKGRTPPGIVATRQKEPPKPEMGA